MPSPASSTVPVSTTDTFCSNPSICWRMIWLISSARISMTPVLLIRPAGLVQQFIAHLFQARAHAAVEHQVPHPRHHAADQVGLDGRLHDHLAAGAPLE